MFSVSFQDSGASRTHRLREGVTVIGRAPTCDIVINHPTVSRQHTKLRLAGGHCVASDAGSRFGTKVNGEVLEGELELTAGDVLAIGSIAVTIDHRVDERELLSEQHQLLEDSGTLLIPVSPSGDKRTDAPPSERRSGRDRRRLNLGRGAGERRAGRERRGSRFLRLIAEIANTLVTVQPLSDMLGRVVDLVFEVVPAERVFLMLRDAPDEPLTARVMRNRDHSVPDQPSLSRTVVNRVMKDRIAMLASDAVLDARLETAASVQAMNVRSFMCAPLWNRDDVIGVMYCDNPRAKRFTPEDLEVFTAFCGYSAVAIEQSRLSAQLMEELKRRERLSRYHSPAVVNRILHGGTGIDAPFLAQEREVTVMFCDLVAFTEFSERRAPFEVATVLNGFFSRMAEVIFHHEGTLDKFIGDALLAVFGAPFEQPDHPTRAAAAARDMRRALASMNAQPNATPLQVRIGLNTGQALTGDIGSPRRREFTVLGDVVNTASRVQRVAAPDQILMTESTWKRVKEAFETRPVGANHLRGREEVIELYELIDLAPGQ
ncbi:MAG TPA: adenylate/guanylate cyclase domain-containing protein [Vicinamibacterales bacterium]|jgi:adenylate cyclase|nr:adenylate/guanylate cyclase domain-containing protein [Vicinamibacterales bacterium]